MTSRNKREGYYVGTYKGKFIRAHDSEALTCNNLEDLMTRRNMRHKVAFKWM